MIPKVKCVSGATILAGTIVRLPWGKGKDQRIAYGTFEGVHGNTRVRTIGIALTRGSRGTKAVNVMHILDGEKVHLGRSTIFYSHGVPFTVANGDEQDAYKAKVAEAIRNLQAGKKDDRQKLEAENTEYDYGHNVKHHSERCEQN